MIRVEVSSLQFTSEVSDGPLQALFQRNHRLPFEDFPGKGDVRLALLRIVRWQRLEDEFALPPDEFERQLGELQHREFAGVSKVHRPHGLRLVHERDDSLDQIVSETIESDFLASDVQYYAVAQRHIAQILESEFPE